MPRPKVGGLRSAFRSEEKDEKETTALPARKNGKVQFQSKAAAYRLSVRRRIIKFAADGEKYEDIPKTAIGTPLDQVIFENNYFETEDMELAEAMKKTRSYGMPSQGGEFWDLEEMRAMQDAAEVSELKRRLAQRPDLAEKVFKPGTAEGLELPEQPPA